MFTQSQLMENNVCSVCKIFSYFGREHKARFKICTDLSVEQCKLLGVVSHMFPVVPPLTPRSVYTLISGTHVHILAGHAQLQFSFTPWLYSFPYFLYHYHVAQWSSLLFGQTSSVYAHLRNSQCTHVSLPMHVCDR